MMKLIGNYLSPFVRRVAISLNAMGMPYQLEQVRVFDDPDPVRRYNPLVRIPALVLDDGETLVDSAAILDAVDELAGPQRRLTPESGAARRNVMRITAIGLGSMEKAQLAFYEVRFHPAAKVHVPWIDHNESRALSGFEYLDLLAREAGDEGWLAGTGTVSQADITAVVAWTFANAVRKNLDLAAKLPNLARFSRRCEAMDAFARAPLPVPAI
jgi:glutathione S-transferase